eukprot:6492761-Amphidinium_carterae.3
MELQSQHALLCDADLMQLLLQECETTSIPRNAGRTNILDRPRSLLLGLYTRRGLGISRGTSRNLTLLSLIHTLASRRPHGGSAHPYCAVMLTRLEEGQGLSSHRDEYNSLLNWVLPLCSNSCGGEVWLETGQPTDYVHRAQEADLDTDMFTPPGVARTEGDSQLTLDGIAGCTFSHPGQWLCFDSRRRHSVLPIRSGCRFSIALFSPTRLEHVPAPLWVSLASLGFPVGPIQRLHSSLPCLAAHGRVGRRRGRSPLAGLLTSAAAATSASASAVPCVADHGARLRLGWEQALHGPHALSWRPSRFCDFYTSERSTLRAGVPAATLPVMADVLQQWPCGWPFPEAELTARACTSRPPRSRRRRDRWLKWRQLKRFVNFKVCYLSWLHLGRPAHRSLTSPDPMNVPLNSVQTAMCARFLAVASTKCRPRDALASTGSGLSLFRASLEELASTYTRRPQTTGPKTDTVTVDVSNVSLPQRAGVVPLDDRVLPKYLVDVLKSEDGLLLPAAERVVDKPPMYVDVQDWPALALQLLNLHMVELTPESDVPLIDGQQCRAGIFGVPKASGNLCRMIIDRRPRNAVEMDIRTHLLRSLMKDEIDLDSFTAIWRRMCLPHAMVLMDMVWGPSTSTTTSTEDCADYFYLLAMPSHRAKDTVLGYPLAGHQLGVAAVQLAGLSYHPDALYSICLTTVAMGDIKAMEVAQAVHQTVLLRHAHLPESGWISLGWELGDGPHFWGAYCDDYAQISLMEEASCIPEFRPPAVKAAARAQLDQVHSAYSRTGLIRKEAKAETDVRSPTFWGATIDSDEGTIHGNLGKLQVLVVTTQLLLAKRYVTSACVERVVGYWTHHALFLRMSLSLFQDVYPWLAKHRELRFRLRPLPQIIRDEFLGMLGIWTDLECYLRSAPADTLFASDASDELGAVVSTPLSLHEAVLAWSLRSNAVAKGTAIMSEKGLYKLSREEAKQPLLEDLVQSKNFSLVSVYRFSRPAMHINYKEMLAARTAIRAAAHSPSLQCSRLTLAIDSQVVVWLLRKGRSSSRALNRLVQSCLVLLISSRIRLHPLWISTERNPADDPTRRVQIREGQSASPDLQRAINEVPQQWPWVAEMTRLLWSKFHEYDDTLGFPGEGPMLQSMSKDLRLSVQPATIKRYTTCVNRVRAWLALEGLPALETLCASGTTLATVLSAYVQYCYDHGQPYTHALEALAGVQFFFPHVQGSLQAAWRTMKTWGQLKPVQVRSPMPVPVLLALVTAALTMGWDRTAGVLLLGFEALLRPTEMGSCLRGHLSLPEDLYGHPHCAILCLPETKTSTRTVKVQSVLIKDAPLIGFLQSVFAADHERVLLSPGGAVGLQRKFLSLRTLVGIQNAPWTLASVRGGGCVHFALHSNDMDYLQWKGRWSTQRSMRHYMQMGLGAASFSSLGDTDKGRIMELAALASPLLRLRQLAREEESTQKKVGDAGIPAGALCAELNLCPEL